MNSFIITYDVAKTGDYSNVYAALYEAIKSYGTWAHITESCWAIKTDLSVVAVRDNLLRLMRQGDRLMVVQTAHVAAWNNTICNNDWLKENI